MLSSNSILSHLSHLIHTQLLSRTQLTHTHTHTHTLSLSLSFRQTQTGTQTGTFYRAHAHSYKPLSLSLTHAQTNIDNVLFSLNVNWILVSFFEDQIYDHLRKYITSCGNCFSDSLYWNSIFPIFHQSLFLFAIEIQKKCLLCFFHSKSIELQ